LGSQVTAGRVLLEADTSESDDPNGYPLLPRSDTRLCQRLGKCANIATFARYLSALETRVDALMKDGVSLAELRDRCDLPEFARWDQYELLHPKNANYTYLRLERSQFK